MRTAILIIGLLSGGARTGGAVASINTFAGTSIITLRNGSQVTEQAPALPQYEVEV